MKRETVQLVIQATFSGHSMRREIKMANDLSGCQEFALGKMLLQRRWVPVEGWKKAEPFVRPFRRASGWGRRGRDIDNEIAAGD